MGRKVSCIVLLSVLSLAANAQEERLRWVDSVFRTLNRQEKAAQLMILGAPADPASKAYKDALELAEDGIGAVHITHASPTSHVQFVNKLQQNAPIPLLIETQAMYGARQSIDSVLGLPWPLLVGALPSDTLAVQWGAAIGRQMKVLGAHLNLEVSDPRLPSYLMSFGQKERFTAKWLAYHKGLTSEGVVTSDLDFYDASTSTKPLSKPKGDAELQGFLSGMTMIWHPTNARSGIKKIAKAARRDKQLELRLDSSVRKILGIKFEVGLANRRRAIPDNIRRRLNDPDVSRLQDLVAASAVTLVANSDSLVPIRSLDDRNFIHVSVGNEPGGFNRALEKYAPFNSFNVLALADTNQVTVNPGDVVVVGIHGTQDSSMIRWITGLASRHKLIVVHFGNPAELVTYSAMGTLVAAYTDEDYMTSAVAQLIFGAIPAKGLLPVDAGPWPVATGLHTRPIQRLSYGAPESVGLSSRTLERIKTIMEEAIATGATPGCMTLVAKDGKIVYSQAAGWLTYEKTRPVTPETIYDLASVTKISATLQTVLFMHDHGLIDINKKVSYYLPEMKKSNKADFTIKDILTHQAGLWPFLPFWTQTLTDSTRSWKTEFYDTIRSDAYPFPVSENLFASKSMKDSLWQWIIKARVRDKPPRTPFDYRYSDMGFYVMQHLAEKLLNQPMEDFLAQNLYDPLGAYTTGYLPLSRFSAERIAPTERDTLFRKSLLIGYVHDQGAAMHGGIAGHAGLFSTANDLAKVGQMWLQKGTYGGVRYFKPETIELFSSKQFSDSRRGLGWDKATPGDWSGPTSRYASGRTFGHTGFTGTCIWVDPEFNLVFIFLSNRVMPDMNNNKLLNTNVRPRIQQVVYEAMFDYCSGKK